MKAPDKIYGEVNDNGFVCGYAEPIKSDDVEYIRKDALLEWVKHRLENLNNVNFNEDNYDAGKNHILSDLIDKLNSM